MGTRRDRAQLEARRLQGARLLRRGVKPAEVSRRLASSISSYSKSPCAHSISSPAKDLHRHLARSEMLIIWDRLQAHRSSRAAQLSARLSVPLRVTGTFRNAGLPHLARDYVERDGGGTKLGFPPAHARIIFNSRRQENV